MPPLVTNTLNVIVEKYISQRVAMDGLTCSLVSSGDSDKRYLLFRRTDGERQTLLVPIDPITDDISPFITAVKTGVMLLGGPPRG